MPLRSLLVRVRTHLRGRKIRQLQRRGLTLGSGFSLQSGAIIDESHCHLITIGNDVTLAPNAILLAHDASTKRPIGYTRIAPVVIGDRVFVGAGAIVLPGVSLGSDVVVGAGSVVTRDVPDGTVVAGNPAREVAKTEEYLGRQQQRMAERPVFGLEFTHLNSSEARRAVMREQMDGGDAFIV
ncbi:MAG: acyltransferase [Bacteroidota bacterium]